MTLSTDRINVARAYMLQSAEVKKRVAETCMESLIEASDLITEAFQSGCKLMLCGNGGSAADCQHVATELVSRLTNDFQRPSLPAIALTTDTSLLTAYANDTGFDGVFERQVQGLGKPGDVLIGISTSGESNNVVRAIAAASENGLRTIALTGESGRIKEMADVSICVPSANTQHIQEAHIALEHMLCHLVERMMFGSSGEATGQK